MQYPFSPAHNAFLLPKIMGREYYFQLKLIAIIYEIGVTFKEPALQDLSKLVGDLES